MSAGEDFNPRWVNYCRAIHKAGPDEVGGGPITRARFIRWLDERWKEWRLHVGRTELGRISMEDHAAFDRWLDEWEMAT